MEVNLTVEALKFMVLGMGIVFLFLITLIYVLKLQASLVAKFFPEKVTTATKSATTPKASETANNSKKIAAIVAAVQHPSVRNKANKKERETRDMNSKIELKKERGKD
eukprot:Anaeramoba_flamelloidesc22885_g1_i2.p1 GENE.c22885_g1_i2~~c22885_g1_i2.p1  ORF type:complete len:108 (+),score=6.89 c22885_g1_i2:2-325(+)